MGNKPGHHNVARGKHPLWVGVRRGLLLLLLVISVLLQGCFIDRLITL